jgi:hypothetical protein
MSPEAKKALEALLDAAHEFYRATGALSTDHIMTLEQRSASTLLQTAYLLRDAIETAERAREVKP